LIIPYKIKIINKKVTANLTVTFLAGGERNGYRMGECVLVGVLAYSREAVAHKKQTHKKKRFCIFAKSQLLENVKYVEKLTFRY
jgi:hypothetical protein